MVDYEFHPEAEAELLEAGRFYEAESSGLGVAFLSELERSLDAVLRYPESGPVITSKGVRRKVLRRFPYSLLYSIERHGLFIVAVAHQRRRPGYWSHRTR